MFTGIIETVGKLVETKVEETNIRLTISSDVSKLLKIDQSVAHNGVCLTVVKINDNTHEVVLVKESIDKTNFGITKKGDSINLERCMMMNGRLDGHMVQGHIDTTAKCIIKENLKGSWKFVFEYDKKFAQLVIEKGSISINGVSLTCFNIDKNTFEVAIIPYTYDHTNFSSIEIDHLVNIEFDIIGKYISRIHQLS